MAEKTQSLVLQWVTLVIAFLLLVGSITWFAAPVVKVPTAKEIAGEIKLPEIPEAPVVDLTSVEDRLIEIETTLNEDEDWENEAEALATAEWEAKNYKNIYEAIDNIFGNIDDKDDIEYVTVKDEEVTSFDTKDKDATVVQEVKVKYESKVGNDKKIYLTITTIIEDGEVEDQEIEETS